MRFEKFGLERFFARYEFTVRHMLTASDPESMTVRELLALEPDPAEAQARLLDLGLGYTDSRGRPELRAAIAALYEATPAERVLVHAGAQEPILTFALALLEPGDAVVVQTPRYQSLAEVMRWTGAEVIDWPVHEDDGWQLDPDQLTRLAPANTKALVINVPHNPTGALMSLDRQDRLVALARHHGWWVLSDEAYRGLELDPCERLPALCDRYERAVSTGALAKGWGLGGLRIGWAATHDRTLMAQLEAVKDYTTICSPAPSELLAEIAVRHTDLVWARTRARVARHRELMQAYLDASGRFSWVPPRAGTMGFMRLEIPADGTATALCERVLAEAGVLLAPGPLFSADDRHVRIGLGREGFGAGLAALAATAPPRPPSP